MPLGDVSWQDAALDAVVNSWPASGAAYRLYASDPEQATTLSDAELGAVGGYAPVTFDKTAWSAAASGSKSGPAVDFGTSTDAWSDTALYWGIVDGSGLLVYSDFLDEPLVVDAAGTIDNTFTPTLLFADGS